MASPNPEPTGNLFWLKPDFFECLKTVGVTENRLTVKEIIEAMNKYILANKLFNVNDPMPPKTFYLGDNPLAKVLGVKQFTVPELRRLLPYQIIALTNKNNVQNTQANNTEDKNALKRKLNEEGEGTAENKKAREETVQLYKYGTFLYPYRGKYESGEETDYSVQSFETECVRDSGDDVLLYDGTLTIEEYHRARNNIPSSSDDDEAGIEFEVQSVSSLSAGCSDTSSDEEDIVCAALIIAKDDSDKAFWADESDEDTPDSELTLADKWSCNHCGSFNEPVYRYCQRCWDMRIHWLPEKNKHHPPNNLKKKPRKPVGKVLPFIKQSSQSCEGDSSFETQSSQPSTSQESLKLASSSQDSCCEKLPSRDLNESSNGEQKCPICHLNPKTGIFLHGKTSHQYCCYKCAKIIQKSRQTCPVCRRPISRVARNFLVLS